MVHKQKSAQKNARECVMGLKPSKTRMGLIMGGELVGRVEIARRVGKRILGIDDIKVWAKESHPEKKAPDYTKFEGYDWSDNGIRENDKMLLGALGITKQENGKYNHSKETLLLLTKEEQRKVRPFYELKDNASDEELGRVIVGYGDAYGNGAYGAGPTRNPLRATYGCRLITVAENVVLAKKTYGIFSVEKALPDLVAKIVGSGYQANETGSMSFQLEKDGEKIYADVSLINTSKENAGFGKSTINGDIVVVLSAPWISAHAFIPPEGRGASPLYGAFESMFGGQVDGIYGKATQWFNEQFGKLDALLNNIIPPGLGHKKSEAITVDNT